MCYHEILISGLNIQLFITTADNPLQQAPGEDRVHAHLVFHIVLRFLLVTILPGHAVTVPTFL